MIFISGVLFFSGHGGAAGFGFFHDALAEDQHFQHRVGGQPVGAVHAGTGRFAGGKEARELVSPQVLTLTPPIK